MMNKKDFLTRHWFVFILALFVGALTLFPQVFAVRSLGDRFSGIYPEISDDERYYMARGREVTDGHFSLSNPYLYEHKDGPALQFWVPDFIIAQTSHVLRLSLHETYLFFDFLCPAILVLLTYAIVFVLTENVRLSLSSTIVLHCGIFLSTFNRSPSPQFNFIFFLALFLTLVLFVKTKKPRWGVLSALILGSLFHIYTYYWTYFFVLIPVFLAFSFFFLRGEFVAKPYFGILSGAVFLGIPYFFQMFESVHLPFYSETLARLGMIHTHFPSGFAVLLLSGVLSLCFLFLLRKKIVPKNGLSIFLFSAVISAPIVTNQHVVTGGNLEFSSHYFLLSVFVLVFTIAYLFHFVSVAFLHDKRREAVLWFVLIFSVVISVPNMFLTARSQSRVSPALSSEQRYGDVLRWLDAHTQKDSVVVSNGIISSLVPEYTHNNVLFARESNFHFMSDLEVQDRFILSHYLERKFDDEFVRQNERSLFGVYYIDRNAHIVQENKLRRFLGFSLVPESPLSEKEIQTVLERRKAFDGKSFHQALSSSPYRVDYLLWDTIKNPEWEIQEEEKDGFRKVFEINGIAGYEISRDKAN